MLATLRKVASETLPILSSYEKVMLLVNIQKDYKHIINTLHPT